MKMKNRGEKGGASDPQRDLEVNVSAANKLRSPLMVDATGLHVFLSAINPPNARNQTPNAEAPVQKREIVRSSVEIDAIANIATNAWRIKTKVIDSETGEAKEEMKRLYRHIEAIFESLEQIGVETIDPAGNVYDSGMALKVLSFEPTPGLTHEEIKETIKPSIVWQGRLIQIGEVIVGIPKLV